MPWPTLSKNIVMVGRVLRSLGSFLLAWAAFSPMASAQAPETPGPAPVLLVVLDEVSAYGAVRQSGEELGTFQDSPDGGFFLTGKAGKNELRIEVRDCGDEPLVFNLTARQRYLMTLSRIPNPDPKTQGKNPMKLRYELVPLEGLPAAKGKAEVAALYFQGAAPNLSGSVEHGMAAARSVTLPKGRVVSLGQGKTGLRVGGKPVVFCNPAEEPLVYLFVLLEKGGVVRSVKTVF